MATRPPDSVAMEALAAQVADLRGAVATVKARQDAAGLGTGFKAHERLAELAAQVAALTAKVAELTDEGTPGRPVVPNWSAMTGDEHTAAAADLGGWYSGFLLASYPRTPYAPCWDKHPDALWELSVLRAEWQRVYDRKAPELAGAIAFHQHLLPGVSARLTAILADCQTRHHAKTPALAPVRPRAQAG
jgi:hypothetical protein